tara:strand:+ start:1783 stop:2145 length:363 start_codon:yes stop_codon:yes gene_type:complete
MMNDNILYTPESDLSNSYTGIKPYSFSKFDYAAKADGDNTLFTRKSIVSGTLSTITIAMHLDEFLCCFAMWAHDKCLIQDCFPDLDDNEREFIMSGITVEEWTEIYGPDDDTELNNAEVA